MENTEFIVVLTDHRFLGRVFLPYLVCKNEKFFTVERHLKLRDLKSPECNLTSYERALVEIMEKYSDERLMKRFTRETNVTRFFTGIDPAIFEKQITPFIDECMFKIATILMVSPVHLFNKDIRSINIYPEDEIRVSPLYAKPVFYFERKEAETSYRLRVFLDNQEIPLQNSTIKLVSNHPCVFTFRDQLIAFDKLDAKKLKPFFSKSMVSVPNTLEESYYAGFVRKTIRDYEVKAVGFTIDDREANHYATLTLEENLMSMPSFLLRFHYDRETFFAVNSKNVVVLFTKSGSGYHYRKIRRNSEWEQSVIQRIEAAGLVERNGFFTLPAVELPDYQTSLYYLIHWYNQHKELLTQHGITLAPSKLNKNYFTGQSDIEIVPTLKEDWFDLYVVVTFGDITIPFIKLKKYILNGIREFELPNGEVAIIPPEWLARYKHLLTFSRNQNGRMLFPREHMALLEEILPPGGNIASDFLKSISQPSEDDPLPEGLQATLRSYQRTGLAWMTSLHKNSFGGCLADDMGLGKTLQTLSLLLRYRQSKPSASHAVSQKSDGQLQLFAPVQSEYSGYRASLIVVPTSLVHNWQAEITKFTPSLRVYNHTGPQRQTGEMLLKAAQENDIIITTYGILRNDIDWFSGMNFFYLVLDESQYIKNPSSKTYKSVMLLQGEHRLALTGTPVENSLSDLWAQMNFLNPGMLGSLPFFRRHYLVPIEKQNDQESLEKLQILTRPFLLRRRKEEVEQDLPPLMEQIILCEMEERQQQVYETEKSMIRNSILASIEQEGVKWSSVFILEGLTRLRQLANHPLMLNDLTIDESGKFEEIFLMLENVVAEKHKVLIFSSFVKHLELIRERLEKLRLNYAILTGKTQNRKEVIDRFQNHPDVPVFLISLKAGGVGLNLTGADYVFIIDPWWNPASENQAISRSHRIGQNKPVFVYRFITRNSIEEKIRNLQQKKSSLADKLINSNNPLQNLTSEEVMNIFS